MSLFKKNKKKYVSESKFSTLVDYINNHIITQHNGLEDEFIALRDEIATNGVVRDIKRHDTEIEEINARFSELENNGVATAINKLNKEVFNTRKDKERSFLTAWAHIIGEDVPQEATIAGKVEAIIEHLGIDVTVKPQEVITAKVEARKLSSAKASAKKKPVTKKGKK